MEPSGEIHPVITDVSMGIMIADVSIEIKNEGTVDDCVEEAHEEAAVGDADTSVGNDERGLYRRKTRL